MTAWCISTLMGGALFLAAAARGPAVRWQIVPVAKDASGGLARRRAAAILDRLGRTSLAARIGRADLTRRRLDLAGRPFDVAVLRGAQVVAGTGGAALFILFGRSWLPAVALAPFAGLAGVRVPEFLVARRAHSRRARIAAGVPDLVELLLATVEAGLGPAAALARICDIVPGPLGDEARSAVREVELGVPWQLALERLVDRTEVPSLRAVAVALTRSQRLGTSVAVTLRRVMEDLRRDRRLRAEEAARNAPLKMLVPLVFLILPAFLLLTVGPVVLATIRSLH
jgi:tight adherence protein C